MLYSKANDHHRRNVYTSTCMKKELKHVFNIHGHAFTHCQIVCPAERVYISFHTLISTSKCIHECSHVLKLIRGLLMIAEVARTSICVLKKRFVFYETSE